MTGDQAEAAAPASLAAFDGAVLTALKEAEQALSDYAAKGYRNARLWEPASMPRPPIAWPIGAITPDRSAARAMGHPARTRRRAQRARRFRPQLDPCVSARSRRSAAAGHADARPALNARRAHAILTLLSRTSAPRVCALVGRFRRCVWVF
jgi:hypothetical protein